MNGGGIGFQENSGRNPLHQGALATGIGVEKSHTPLVGWSVA
jgi:hypothetical protein